jgi:Tfp pilus assembly protein FimT
VELILVLLLIGVSLLIVLPNINKGLQDREVRGSALGLAAVARDLRSRALMDGVPQQLVLYLAQQSYQWAVAARSCRRMKFSSVNGGETVGRDIKKFYFFPTAAHSARLSWRIATRTPRRRSPRGAYREDRRDAAMIHGSSTKLQR